MQVQLTHYSAEILNLINQKLEHNFIELRFDYPDYSNNTLSFPILYESKILDKSKTRYFHCKTLTGFKIRSNTIKDPKSFFTSEIIKVLTELSFSAYQQHITTHMIYVSEYKTFEIPPYKSLFEINAWVKNAIARMN